MSTQRTDGEGAAVGVVRLNQMDYGALLVGGDAAGHHRLADLMVFFLGGGEGVGGVITTFSYPCTCVYRTIYHNIFRSHPPA